MYRRSACVLRNGVRRHILLKQRRTIIVLPCNGVLDRLLGKRGGINRIGRCCRYCIGCIYLIVSCTPTGEHKLDIRQRCLGRISRSLRIFILRNVLGLTYLRTIPVHELDIERTIIVLRLQLINRITCYSSDSRIPLFAGHIYFFGTSRHIAHLVVTGLDDISRLVFPCHGVHHILAFILRRIGHIAGHDSGFRDSGTPADEVIGIVGICRTRRNIA